LVKYEKYKEGKFVANHVFPIPVVGISFLVKNRYLSTLFTLSILKGYGDVATLT
jgi:hypothetical protein